MKTIYRRLTVIILIATCTISCASMLYDDEGHVDRLVISNLSDFDVENVVLLVPKTRRIISTNQILRGTDYSLEFPVTTTDDNPSFIEWEWRGTIFRERLQASNEDAFYKEFGSKPFTVKIELLNAGQLSVRLE